MDPRTPQTVVRPEELAAIDDSPRRMAAIPGSRMFEIKEALAVFRKADPDAEMFDASQGDGGASLPGVPEELLDAAHALQKEHGTGYDKPFGAPIFRTSVVEDYWRLDAATGFGPENVLAGQGGRDALVKAYDAAQILAFGRRGDFVAVSRVPWISYNWGPYAVGANVLLAPGDEDEAWALTPEAVAACVEAAARYDGRKVVMLVITSPDNPTGRSMAPERQLELARAAFSAGIPFVLFDWIYHRVTDEAPHDLNAFLLAMDPDERDRCIFLDGITKSLGASNIRNAHLVASKALVKLMQSRASHAVIPSFHSQAVAIAAYRMGFDRAAAPIIGPTNASRGVMESFVAEHGIRAILGKGYYAFIDVGPWIDRAGLADGAEVGAILAERFGLAVVPGLYFSDFGARWIRFSYALPPEVTRAATARLWQGLSSL
ncbi:MAG TPA: aminotransferase class I/II-fold pyridoxal phosphate-dependent enzyme [Methylomirabilota bacterium]|nr:aminotransferase class I/II-fold pyridoxal phosphate-dependent enzyme [Methylomirabilota bacterium]